ncbi:MAG: iron chaperone, partial [Gammaproteobacteria bacterium]
MSDRLAPRNTDEYIATFSPEVQSILEKIRSTIREAVPEAEEKLSYQMPAFTLNGDLIYFAAFKKHIGLYPPVMGDENLRKVT